MAEPDATLPPEPVDDGVDALETPEASTGSSEPIRDDTDALEKPETSSSSSETKTESAITSTSPVKNEATPTPTSKGLRQRLKKFNIYLLMFMFILMAAIMIITVAYFQGKKQSTTSKIKAQTLTSSTLQQLATSDATVGSAQQVLNIQSSAVFAGKVLIRDGLEVATNLRVGGVSSLNNVDVAGTAQVQQLQVAKDLAVTGNSSIQGSQTIGKSLQVSGSGTFGGPLSAPQVTTNSLQLNGDLVLTHHISAGGVTPGVSRGSALGNGGSVSISGSDTSGSVSVNVGSGAAAGCFATINFAVKYNSTPHVIISPIGSPTGTLDYYANRSTSSFSICNSTPPPPGGYAFDYFVVE